MSNFVFAYQRIIQGREKKILILMTKGSPHSRGVIHFQFNTLLVFLKKIVTVTDKLRALMEKLSGRPTSPLGSRFLRSNLPLKVVTRLVNHLHLPASALF